MQILEPSPKIAAWLVRSPREGGIDIHPYAADHRWQLARRIAESGSLGRSRLLSEFLLYVVDRHIRNRIDEITEQQIGILVFGRAEGYDSNDDNIVRSYARNLRKRLNEYYATEGKDESMRLEIPRGGYAPTFSTRIMGPGSPNDRSQNQPPVLESNGVEEYQLSSLTLDPQATQIPLLQPADTFAAVGTIRRSALSETCRRHKALLTLCIGVVIGVICSVLLPVKYLKRATASSAEAASTNLWAQLFSNERDTFIVPSDDGLIIMQGLTQRPVPLASYVNGTYRTNLRTDGVPGAPEILKLGGRRYTSVVDLNFVAHLAQLDEVVPGRMMIRYARDLRMDDLRTGNAVLIGSNEANPWIELFQARMNFRFSVHPGSDQSGIVNSHQRAGENALYGASGQDHTYGLIAFVPNLTSTGHVLVVGGLNTAGTEAATTFLLTPSLMMPALERAKGVHGVLQPFELLIGAGNVAANASSPQLILERIGIP
ncbi:MAG: hypothetical protein JWM43_955 [Acidobacteriaceae bacterium]|nr:hypothetical protein [Acidobacteriaceae bacterium]